MSDVATIFNVQRFSTEDGPGIRTTVFFKGCPMLCPWCHNPEGMGRARRIAWQRVHCIFCGDCATVCPDGAIIVGERSVCISPMACSLCQVCVTACPTNALEMLGRETAAEALADELLRDRDFFQESGGGVTLSGGEPMLQHRFLDGLLPRLREAGVHLALDTCGAAKADDLERILGQVDMVLLDMKHGDPDAHFRLTGVPLDKVLANLDVIVESGLPLWVRTPIIPGMTDDPAGLEAIAVLLRERAPSLERWDLLAFSNLCESKYEMLGTEFELAGRPLLAAEVMEGLVVRMKEAGVDCVRWSGPVAPPGVPL